jgi:hypothetical protein
MNIVFSTEKDWNRGFSLSERHISVEMALLEGRQADSSSVSQITEAIFRVCAVGR